MIYVISDLHGYPLPRFLQLLRKVDFSEDDFLFILGDVIDRNGDGGVEMLRWLLWHPNVELLLGNHEAMLLSCDFLLDEITEDGWDFTCPEQVASDKWAEKNGKRVPWETCQTFSGSWGYFRDEASWKSPRQLIELLVKTVAHGGNLIMNVGPTARGEFDERAKERLAGFARWMHWNARSIYGCTVAPEGITAPNGTAVTYNPKTNRAYIHLYDYPMGYLPVEWLDRIEYAQFLHDGSELIIRQPPQRHAQDGEQKGELGGIRLPMKKPHVEIPVIEIWLKK